MSRVKITDYESDGAEVYTLRVSGLDEAVRVIIPPDEEQRTRVWIGATYYTQHPQERVIHDSWGDIMQAVATFGDVLLAEREARRVAEVIREAEQAALRAYAAAHTNEDEEE